MHIIVTTTQSKSSKNLLLEEFLAETNFTFVNRAGHSLEYLQNSNAANALIVWHETGPVLHIEGEKFYYHPSMAKNRISLYRKLATIDPLLKACNLQDRDKFLDCTLGLGADATLAAYFNPNGQTIGLESSALIAVIVKWGMKLYKSKLTWLDEAIKRIEVINTDHLTYLQSLPDNNFDIIYFDPMFRKPLLKSQPLSPLRLMANPQPLQVEVVKEALRVARKRVVIKELAGSGEFIRLGVTRFASSPNNKITYGIIDID